MHETKSAMTLKELENRCYKEKGIVAKTVKEIADELVADNLVCCEKIGSSNYYWSFPSQGLVVRRQKIETWEESVNTKKRRRDELEEEQNKLAAERDDGSGREEKLKQLKVLQEEEAELDVKLGELRANDPELIEALEKDLKVAKEAVERWTDNLMTLKKIFTNATNLQESDFDQAFECKGIDYME